LGGGAVAARLVPGLFPVSLVAMARLRGFLSLLVEAFEFCLPRLWHVFFKFLDCTTRQAPEEQRKTVLLFAQFRGAHLFDDPMHQHCPRRGLERTHLSQIS
jgi:hypothetical protein